MPLTIKRTNTTSIAANSVLFNGSNQYLSIANNAAFNLGTGSFTVECWFYATANVSSTQCLITNYGGPSAGWAIQIFSGVIGANVYGDGFAISGGIPVINTWYHVALSGAQGSIKLFLNGVQIGSTYTGAVSMNTSAAVTIGNIVNTAHMAGYISNARVVKGTALYTASFTAPTTPLTAIANTSLLTCNAATIIDGSTNNFTITNNSATVSSLSPFRAPINNFQFARRTPTAVGKSVLFDGTNDYLSVGRILDNSTDVTIEAWVRVTSASDAYIVAQYVAGSVNRTIFYLESNLKVGIQIGSTYVDSVAAITLNTWYHLAWVRSGSGTNNFSTYINGVRDGQMTYTGTFHNTPTTIGGSNNYDAYGNSYFPGYISNLRILKGTALYTGASFIPPTSPLTAIANTALLTCNADTIFDSSTNNFTITNNNGATVSSTTPFVASGGGMSLKKVYADPATIVTNGLVLNLDASNASSYPGSGTTWTDLSGNSNTGTLTNGPTYTSSFGGSIVFDGTNDSVVTNTAVDNTLNTCTFSAWINRTNLTNKVGIFNNYANFSGFGVLSTDASAGDISFFYTHLSGYNYTGRYTNANAILANNWYHVVGTWDGTFSPSGIKIYINGIRSDSTSISGGSVTAYAQSEYAMRIGSAYWSNAERGFFNGNIAQVLIYNRSLSASEVLQNYNATKARFGL